MGEWLRRHATALLLAAFMLCMAAAPAVGRTRGGETEAAGARPPAALRAVGEEIALRAFLPREPVFWETLGAWQTHAALDLRDGDVRALRAGVAARVWTDVLWGVCVEADCGGETWIYRSLEETSVRPGERIAAGDVLGRAGHAPIEAELGPHAHIERWRDASPADPLGE